MGHVTSIPGAVFARTGFMEDVVINARYFISVKTNSDTQSMSNLNELSMNINYSLFVLKDICNNSLILHLHLL